MKTYLFGMVLGLLLCFLTMLLDIDSISMSIITGAVGMIIALILERYGWLD